MGRELHWAGVDDPTRRDHAVVDLDARSMRAVGASQSGAPGSEFASAWQLDVADGWITRSLSVTTRGFGWSRELILTRSAAGIWSAEADARGETDLAAPGLDDPDALDGAIDCDLGLCPVTNTMPIRRLRLLDGEVDENALVMAWVEMPSLRVIRSDQVYASGPDAHAPSERRVRYRSYSRDFHAELTVDADGLVIDYPGLAVRVRDRSGGPSRW